MESSPFVSHKIFLVVFVLVTMGRDAKVLERSKVPIIARVLVLEEQMVQGKLTLTRLHVQAQILEINKRKVEQFKIQEIVMELDNDKNEVLAKRTVVMLSLTEAEIHKRPRETDHHVHCHRKGGNYIFLIASKAKSLRTPLALGAKLTYSISSFFSIKSMRVFDS